MPAQGGRSAQAALERIARAGGHPVSWVQVLCELQRDWARTETVSAFIDIFIDTGGTAGIQFAYDREERETASARAAE